MPDADSQPFWDACREQRLVAQRCDDCLTWRWPPRGVCAGCASWAASWQTLPGTGVVQSFVVPHRAFNPAFAGEVPYVVVHVQLEGTGGRVVLTSNLRGCDWQTVTVGMPVQVFFTQAGLPEFRPR